MVSSHGVDGLFTTYSYRLIAGDLCSGGVEQYFYPVLTYCCSSQQPTTDPTTGTTQGPPATTGTTQGPPATTGTTQGPPATTGTTQGSSATTGTTQGSSATTDTTQGPPATTGTTQKPITGTNEQGTLCQSLDHYQHLCCLLRILTALSTLPFGIVCPYYRDLC